MKLVIDIPDNKIKLIKDCIMFNNLIDIDIYDTVLDAVRNGKPLPQGHGRLIDYSWVVENVIKKLGIKDERYLLESEKALMSIIKIAPTIIETDKETDE